MKSDWILLEGYYFIPRSSHQVNIYSCPYCRHKIELPQGIRTPKYCENCGILLKYEEVNENQMSVRAALIELNRIKSRKRVPVNEERRINAITIAMKALSDIVRREDEMHDMQEKGMID